eukprot:jgi/Bigna1/144403/aug1.87_g19111
MKDGGQKIYSLCKGGIEVVSHFLDNDLAVALGTVVFIPFKWCVRWRAKKDAEWKEWSEAVTAQLDRIESFIIAKEEGILKGAIQLFKEAIRQGNPKERKDLFQLAKSKAVDIFNNKQMDLDNRIIAASICVSTTARKDTKIYLQPLFDIKELQNDIKKVSSGKSMFEGREAFINRIRRVYQVFRITKADEIFKSNSVSSEKSVYQHLKDILIEAIPKVQNSTLSASQFLTFSDEMYECVGGMEKEADAKLRQGKLPDMMTKREYLGVAVGDGKLFAVGGYDGSNFLKSGEYLDLKNVDAGWKKLPDMNTMRYGLGVVVGDGKLFAVGGYHFKDGSNLLKSGEYLDLKKMDAGWKKLPDMNIKRDGLGVAVGDSKLFAVGGEGGYRNLLKSGEYLDLKKMDAGWKKLPDMNTERNGLGVAVGDGKLFAVGGFDRSNYHKSGEYLDLKNVDAGWTKIPDMNTWRSCLGVAVGDGKLFAVGGFGGGDSLASGEYLDLKNVNAGWKKIPDMNTMRKGLGVAVGDGKLFAVGGSAGDEKEHKSGEYLRIAM